MIVCCMAHLKLFIATLFLVIACRHEARKGERGSRELEARECYNGKKEREEIFRSGEGDSRVRKNVKN